MNLLAILHEIEKADPEVYGRLDQRRAIFKHFAGFGRKLTAAAVPVALGGLLNRAYAQTPALNNRIRVILNYALQLEYLESNFYQLGLAVPGMITGQARADITQISNDERAHVNFLRSVLGRSATPDPGRRAYDFTASRSASPVPDVFTNYYAFLAVAQALEDTGVRAYKGAAPELVGTNQILEAALQIHAVEARHASRLRTMRRGGPQEVAGTRRFDPKSWIVSEDEGGPQPPLTAPVYGAGVDPRRFPSEANVVQAGINVMELSKVTMDAATEAFDEPLDMVTVLRIASVFLKTDLGLAG
ncbi:ferritin-like domain-containing protein [Solirubrum puertoriconensis]|uniref:Dessication-associated protein n=1 Tax=Solirubrum puertoriconensis TaxID=1751427 RepID=A0A9X0L5Y1_SOLP1|nr:ferritin-like domain-containing protein [Solirubrum puertoriconensis]KUG09170.1 hypothetical protein ASU33_20365 [Solirubrum puertoriconensis]